MKLTLVRAFVMAVDEGGIRAAARAAGLSQVALAKQVREFEELVGQQLFIRSASGARPTSRALELLPEAKLLLDQVRRFESAVQSDAVRPLSVALNPMVGLVMLEQVLRVFDALHPRTRLRFSEGLFSTTAARLREGSLDFAIVAANANSVPPDLVFEPCLNTRNAFIARISHPLAGARTTLAQLVEFEWVQNEAPGGYSDRLGRWFEELGVPPPLIAPCDSLVTALSVLTATDAVVCAPCALAAHPSLSCLVTQLQVDVEPPRSTLGFLSRRGVPHSRAASDLQAAIRSACTLVPDAIAL
jgi:LysR family transcriptional regulator of abg operon